MPRIIETPSGMLNAIGLQNPGIEGFIKRYPRLWAVLGRSGDNQYLRPNPWMTTMTLPER